MTVTALQLRLFELERLHGGLRPACLALGVCTSSWSAAKAGGVTLSPTFLSRVGMEVVITYRRVPE